MKNINNKLKREKRIRSKIKGRLDRPRLSIFRSNKFIYAQIINDEAGKTIVGASEKELGKNLPAEEKGKTKIAKALGFLIAKKALEKKIKQVMFDKGSYAYHGRVKAVAEGAREGGLKF